VAFASMSVDKIFESEEGRRLVTSWDEWALMNKWLSPVGLNGPMVVGSSPKKRVYFRDHYLGTSHATCCVRDTPPRRVSPIVAFASPKVPLPTHPNSNSSFLSYSVGTQSVSVGSRAGERRWQQVQIWRGRNDRAAEP